MKRKPSSDSTRPRKHARTLNLHDILGRPTILLCCTGGKEIKAVAEARSVLGDFLSAKEPEEAPATESVSALLMAELSTIKSTPINDDGMDYVKVGARGLSLLALPKGVDPEALISELFESVIKSKAACAKSISRFVPLEYTMTAKLSSLETAMDAIVARYFRGERIFHYAVEVKVRLNNDEGFDKGGIIRTVVSKVGSRHRVNLSKPGIVVLVEVVKRFMGVTVTENFHKYRRFNLKSCV